MAAQAALVAAPPRAPPGSRARVGAVHPTSSPSSTLSPIFPQKSAPFEPHSPTSPELHPPAVAARPATISPPRAYKNDPRATLPLFPNFPEPAALPTALPTLLPRSAAFRQAPAARRRSCSRRRAAPLAPSAPLRRAAPRHPPRSLLPPPQHHSHREAELPPPFAAPAARYCRPRGRSAAPFVSSALRCRALPRPPLRLPCPTPKRRRHVRHPSSPPLSAAAADSSRVAPPLRSTSTRAVASLSSARTRRTSAAAPLRRKSAGAPPSSVAGQGRPRPPSVLASRHWAIVVAVLFLRVGRRFRV
nr:serine/arginine repetitive matrix protein 1-like [Oryza sativa Japonica Group]